MRTRRKQTRVASRPYEAQSVYSAEMGAPDRRRYRRTPPGAPTVADLVQPSDTIVTSYRTGGIVISVEKAFYSAPTGETLSHFTIVYVPPDRATKCRDHNRQWINECVAVDGPILKLFEANPDEVLITKHASTEHRARTRTFLIS